MSFRHKNKRWSAHLLSPSHRFPAQTRSEIFWSESNRNPDSFVPVSKLAICHGRLANRQKNLYHTENKARPSTGVVWDCLFHEYSLFPVHFSRLYQRHLSKEKRPLLWTSRAHRTYRGRVFSQQFLTRHMRTEQKREKQVSNRTDSSVSVDERQIKESRGGWQRSLPLPDLSRKIEGPLLAG